MGAFSYYGRYKPKPDRTKDLDGLRVYSMEEIVPILGVTHRTLINYIRSGRLKANKIGGMWKISHDNLKQFVNGG